MTSRPLMLIATLAAAAAASSVHGQGGAAAGDNQAFVAMATAAEEAQTHFFLGEHGPALERARAAHRLLAQYPEFGDSAMALRVLHVRATVHMHLGQAREAVEVLGEGEKLVGRIVANAGTNPPDRAVAYTAAARLYHGMATAALLRKDVSGARSAIQKARAAARASGWEGFEEILGLGRLEAQGVVAAAPGSFEAMRAARQILAASGDAVGALIVELTETMSSHSPALTDELLRSAPALLAVASRSERIEIRVRLAQALHASGNENAAVEQLIEAVRLVEESRLPSRDAAAIPLFFSRYIDVYGKLVAILHGRAARGEPLQASLRAYGGSNAEAALYFSEAARARRFSERYGPSLMRSFGAAAGVPASVVDRERQLRLAMVRPPAGMAQLIAAPVQLRAQTENATRAYLEFIESVSRQYPAYAAMAFPRPIHVRDLPPRLDGRVLVSYMVTDSAVYWWLIRNRQIVDFGRSAMERSRLNRLVPEFVQRALEDDQPELCDALVRRPFSAIAKHAGAAPVIVVPDDVLHAVPWDALCGLTARSLGEESVISYAPSLTALAQAAGTPPAATQRAALIVGNTQNVPTVIPGLARFDPIKPELLDAPMAALRHAGFKLSVMQGAHATPEALLARDATPYGVVHFDTHAFALREEPPPSLLLHPSRNAPYGLLTMSDVARMKLRARVVVLSACESALGPGDDPVPGEGIEALARAFLLAGARSVIATLWVVRVPPAAATVESFYREMGANPDSDLAAALHRAKRNTRARFSLRDDWTGFILIGDPGR